MTEWFGNRQKQEEITYKDGKLDEYTYWHKNGQKYLEGTRKQGKLIVKKWDEDGNLIED